MVGGRRFGERVLRLYLPLGFFLWRSVPLLLDGHHLDQAEPELYSAKNHAAHRAQPTCSTTSTCWSRPTPDLDVQHDPGRRRHHRRLARPRRADSRTHSRA